MKIDHLLQRANSKNLKDQSPVEKAKETTGKIGQENAAGGPLKIDTVTISEQARSLQRAQNEPQAPESDRGAVRSEKVNAAKAGLENGSLLSDKVVEQTAEAILESGDLGDIINSRRLAAGLNGSGVDNLSDDPGRLEEIRQRIQSGFYNSSEVAEKIADSMMEDLLA